MIRRPPRSTLRTHSFPTRRSSDLIDTQGATLAWVDLLPDLSAERILAQVSHPRGARSMASHLQSRLGLKGAKAALLRECAEAQAWRDMELLARRIKALPLRLDRKSKRLNSSH